MAKTGEEGLAKASPFFIQFRDMLGSEEGIVPLGVGGQIQGEASPRDLFWAKMPMAVPMVNPGLAHDSLKSRMVSASM